MRLQALCALFLLVFGGCAANQKATGVRVKGYDKLELLSGTLSKNIDKSQDAYHDRLEALYEKINTAELGKKLQALADADGKADVREVAKLIVQWTQVKDKILRDLSALRSKARIIKGDLGKMQVIIGALAELAQLEAQKSELDAADVARILGVIGEAAKDLQIAEAVKDAEEAEFDRMVEEMRAAEEGGGEE